MSLPIKLPVTARPTLTSNIFIATWNNPTINRYDFTAVPATNANQTVLTMTGSSVYVIERVCFSTTLSEGNYQESINSTASVPQLVFKTLKTGQAIFDRPLPFINYVDNLELLLFIPSDQSEDEIQVSFQCVLNGIPATVGIVTIRAFLQLNIYEIQNTDWIRRFYHSTERPGEDLKTRGRHRVIPCHYSLNEGTFG